MGWALSAGESPIIPLLQSKPVFQILTGVDQSSANVLSRLAANAGRYLGRVYAVGYLDLLVCVLCGIAGCRLSRLQQDSMDQIIYFNIPSIPLMDCSSVIKFDFFLLSRACFEFMFKQSSDASAATRRQKTLCPTGQMLSVWQGRRELPDRSAFGATKNRIFGLGLPALAWGQAPDSATIDRSDMQRA